MSSNILKSIALRSTLRPGWLVSQEKLLVQLGCVQIRCLAIKKRTQRLKLPTQAKVDAKWVSKSKVQMSDLGEVSKELESRQVTDPVWLMTEFKPQPFKLEDAIRFHMELAQETMLNNMNGFMFARLLLDMSTKKKNKYQDTFKGLVYFNNFFEDGLKREVIAICKKDEEIAAAREAGAFASGFTDVLKKLERGELSNQTYDYIVCTPEAFPDVMLIKKKIEKEKLPTLKGGTVTENIGQTVRELHLSKEFTTSKITDDRGVVKIKIGTLNMGVDKLVDNFECLVKALDKYKRTDNFITDCVLYAAPSTEKFKVDLSKYTNVEKPDKTTTPTEKAGDKQPEEPETAAAAANA